MSAIDDARTDGALPARHGGVPRPRTNTDTAEIDSTITHPGSVKINVQGAFIVDQEASPTSASSPNGGSYDTKDIRLPNHTAVVSHIAVDASLAIASLCCDMI
jgi:type II pantothenate kinase